MAGERRIGMGLMREALMSVAPLLGVIIRQRDPRSRLPPKKGRGAAGRPPTYHKRRSGWLYEANGNREVERRRRQIASGQLKAENGLVMS